MNHSAIRWYSIDSNMKPEEHEPVGLDDALKIVDRYLSRDAQVFECGEEALAATMFGFNRSKYEFIEICVNSPAEISYKFELSDPDASWFRRVFKSAFQYEKTLSSREELLGKVKEFFTTSGQDIMKKLGDQK